MQLRIAVDLDGVLANTMVTFCNILNQRHLTEFTVNSFDRWNAWEIAHITRDEAIRTLDEAWFDWRSIPQVESGIGEKISRIHPYGRIDIVTGRSQDTVQNAKAWLKENNVPYDGFVRTVSMSAKAKLGYDVFIDDSSELMSVLASSLDRHGILYTQPWNKKAPFMPRIFKVDQWAQVPAILEQISSMKN